MTSTLDDARVAAFHILTRHPNCLQDDEPLQDLIEEIAQAILRAAPVTQCDAETAGAIARDVVTEWLGMFDPPPQIDFMQSEMLQAAIGARLAVSSAKGKTP